MDKQQYHDKALSLLNDKSTYAVLNSDSTSKTQIKLNKMLLDLKKSWQTLLFSISRYHSPVRYSANRRFLFTLRMLFSLRLTSSVFNNRDPSLSLPEPVQTGCGFVYERFREGCITMFLKLFSVLCLVTCFRRTWQSAINPLNLYQYG